MSHIGAWCPKSDSTWVSSPWFPAIDYQIPIILPKKKVLAISCCSCRPSRAAIILDNELTITLVDHFDLTWIVNITRRVLEFLYFSPAFISWQAIRVARCLEGEFPVALQAHLVLSSWVCDLFIYIATTVKHCLTWSQVKFLGLPVFGPAIRCWCPKCSTLLIVDYQVAILL